MRRPARGLVAGLLPFLPLAVGTAVAQEAADCRGCHEDNLTLSDRTYHAGLEEGRAGERSSDYCLATGRNRRDAACTTQGASYVFI